MLQRFLPLTAGNDYRGLRVALWLLALLAVLKGAMGFNCILNGRVVALTADGIPIDTFAPAAAQAVIAFFALWGLGQVLLGLLCAVVLIRYRSLTPFMFAVLLFEQLSRKAIFYFIPVARTGNPPGTLVNLVFLAVMVAGLALSLFSRARS